MIFFTSDFIYSRSYFSFSVLCLFYTVFKLFFIANTGKVLHGVLPLWTQNAIEPIKGASQLRRHLHFSRWVYLALPWPFNNVTQLPCSAPESLCKMSDSNPGQIIWSQRKMLWSWSLSYEWHGTVRWGGLAAQSTRLQLLRTTNIILLIFFANQWRKQHSKLRAIYCRSVK